MKWFLAERGLELSEEKTKITYIRHGFTFLGQTFRKYGSTLRIIPAKQAVCDLKRKVGALTRKYTSTPMIILITRLNRIIRGWANYHRHVVVSETFSRVDNYVYDQLWYMLRRRHPRKSTKWLRKKYWPVAGKRGIFSIMVRYKNKVKVYRIIRACSIKIKRHRKIIAAANPYLPEFGKYFRQRRHNKDARFLPKLSARQMRLAFGGS